MSESSADGGDLSALPNPRVAQENPHCLGSWPSHFVAGSCALRLRLGLSRNGKTKTERCEKDRSEHAVQGKIGGSVTETIFVKVSLSMDAAMFLLCKLGTFQCATCNVVEGNMPV